MTAVRRFLLFFLIFTISHCKREGMEPGIAPPSFSLSSVSGETISLDRFKGKVVLLNFWATWCPPCVAEMPSLNNLYEKLKDKNFVVIGVASQDTKDQVDEFVKSNRINFPVLYDPDGSIAQKFKTHGFPETILISKEGTISLMNDPKTNELVLKVIGERVWDAQGVVDMFLKKLH